MTRIADNDKRTKHSEEIMFFNALVIDLKKAVIHRGPILLWEDNEFQTHPFLGLDRLEEATKHLAKLAECKEQVM